jgi:phospholipid/cholesterol/gamma-HCH transport system permease protein
MPPPRSGERTIFDVTDDAAPPGLDLSRTSDGALVVRLHGAWRLEADLPRHEAVARELDRVATPRLALADEGVARWDSGLLVFLAGVVDDCRARSVPVDDTGLSPGLRRLLGLVQGAAHATARSAPPSSAVERMGIETLAAHARTLRALRFAAETAAATGRLALRRARYRGKDLLALLQDSGAEALPIVALVNFLVGIILAFVGITQLRRFGAEVYVADIVGIAVVRDMAALITAVTLAGRSGAAFAAQIATMKVTQEVDALSTLGISPVEFLVVPRVVALTAMLPLLTLFADAAGVLGGALVGTTMMDQPLAGYLRQTAQAVTTGDLYGGLAKGATYGLLVAVAGTYRGIQAERTAERVGEAATRAVVTGIVAVIAACGAFQYAFFLLGW